MGKGEEVVEDEIDHVGMVEGLENSAEISDDCDGRATIDIGRLEKRGVSIAWERDKKKSARGKHKGRQTQESKELTKVAEGRLLGNVPTMLI